MRKTGVPKICRKSKLHGKKIWRNVTALKSKKVQSIFGKRSFWYYYLQLSFVYKTVSQISFKLFCLGDKRLLSEFLRKWAWFKGHTERFPKYLVKKWNFKKLRHGFVDERALITTKLISSFHWKTLVPFCLQKKRPVNAFLTLIVNYRKIMLSKNKLCHSKQQ